MIIQPTAAAPPNSDARLGPDTGAFHRPFARLPSVSSGRGQFGQIGATGNDKPAEMHRQPGRKGRVSLVGAGPGDPELLTLRAARLIAAADALVYDNLIGTEVLELARPDARLIYVGKAAGNHALPQPQINRLLVDLANEGLETVRLKGGDPFIFGRGGEEMEDLAAAGIEYQIVPGITAAAGAAACTGIPLTHREHAQTLVFATGHLKDDTVDLDWACLARPSQTVVIYMGLGALETICSQLLANGMSPETPAAVVHAATTTRQQVVIERLDRLPQTVKAAGLKSPSLIMIGPVVSLYRQTTASDRQTHLLVAP